MIFTFDRGSADAETTEFLKGRLAGRRAPLGFEILIRHGACRPEQRP